MRRSAAWLAVALALAAESRAEEPARRVVVIGARYRASGFHQAFFGRDYRALWALPVSLEVLDLASFAGGLTPVRRVGGQQTKGLALRGADGRNWTFRGVDKDPSSVLPPDLQGTIVDRIAQDQIAAAHPAGTLVADALLEAAGVPHSPHRLVVMPDDPRLGELREVFAGVVGTIAEYPGAASAATPGFHGASEILSAKDLYARLTESPAERVDSRAFLRARLVDLFLGDWDRHREQWRWMRIPGQPGLQPLPEDRDQVFARFEGLVPWAARQRQVRFVNFGPAYPSIAGITFNGWEQDRWLLADLERPVWDEVASDLRGRLTDAAIEDAVRRLPRELYERDGVRLASDLQSRRDRLPAEAGRFYRHLAREVDVHATDRSERVSVRRLSGGDVEIALALRAESGDAPAAEPHFRRVFRRNETREVRLHLGGGDDLVVSEGPPSGITVRAIGGPGYDAVDDANGGGTRLYDEGPSRVASGPGTETDERRHVAPVPIPKAPWIPPRDWGRRTLVDPALAGGPDLGLVPGLTLTVERFGFRKEPWASRQTFRAGYATTPQRPRFSYEGVFRRENSDAERRLFLLASGVEILRFHGFGNESSDAGPDRFYRLSQARYVVEPSLSLPVARGLRFSLGPVLKYSTTALDRDRLIGLLRPYGSDDFGQLGALAGLRLDRRDRPVAARSGVLVGVEGRFYPELWSVRRGFGEVHGQAAAYLTAGSAPLRPTLALRVGGRRVFGDYPFHEAAFLGGFDTLRGFRPQRFAGDAAVYANTELRLKLGRFFLVLPGDIGMFALADVGRVYLEGEDSDAWHRAFGGGIWIAYLRPENTFQIAVTRSEERTSVYLRAGFQF